MQREPLIQRPTCGRAYLLFLVTETKIQLTGNVFIVVHDWRVPSTIAWLHIHGENIMMTGMTGARGEFSPHGGLDVEKERQRKKPEEETTKDLLAMTCFLDARPQILTFAYF